MNGKEIVKGAIMLSFYIVIAYLILSFVADRVKPPKTSPPEIYNHPLQDEIEMLLRSQEKNTFLTTHFTVNREINSMFAIRNVRNEEMQLAIMKGFSCKDQNGIKWENNKEFEIKSFNSINIEAGESEIIPFRVYVAPTRPQTNLNCRLDLYNVKNLTSEEIRNITREELQTYEKYASEELVIEIQRSSGKYDN